MTAEDYVTGKDLYNPYVEIIGCSPKNNNFYAHINASTFEPLHKHLILPSDDKNRIQFIISKSSFKIFATVSMQDHPFDYETRDHWTRGVRVDGPTLSQTLLGFITEEDVKKCFPRLLRP